MTWRKLELSVPDVGTGTLADLIEKIKELVETLVTALEFILTILAAADDPYVAALKSLINALKSVVEGFLEDVGGYTLYVPIRKRLMTNFLGLGDVTPSWAGELGIFGAEHSPINPDDTLLNEFLVKANRYNGGNPGFFKTVVESLYDEGDVNRPEFFDPDDYVGGIVLVMGTDFDPLGFLDDIWKLGGIFDAPDTTPKVPRPKGLQARTLQGISAGEFSTLLLWDPPEVPMWTLTDLGGIILYPSRYAVLRGRNTTGALSAGSVVDLMGTRTLSTGSTFSNGDMEVIHEGEYDISKVSYLDEGITAAADDSFYYAVAWKLTAYDALAPVVEGGGTELDYWYISNVVRAVPYATIPASTPPDWYRTPSIADLFPQFAALLRRLVAQIEAFASKLLGASDLLEQYITFLKNEVARYEALVNEILDELAKLEAKFDLPTAGIYTRTFKGQGGNDYFIADLAQSLNGSDSTAPPFNKGDEYVMGVVILTGGPEVQVDALISGLSWIFGSASEDGMDEMLAELSSAVGRMEATTFGADMRPTTETATKTEFDPAMCPLTSCNAPTTEASTFGPDMKVT